MAFAAVFVERNVCGGLYEEIFTFTGANGDTGGTVQTGLKTIDKVHGDGELADGSANIAALVVGVTATKGQIRITYTDPTANHKGRIVVRGRY